MWYGLEPPFREFTPRDSSGGLAAVVEVSMAETGLLLRPLEEWFGVWWGDGGLLPLQLLLEDGRGAEEEDCLFFFLSSFFSF